MGRGEEQRKSRRRAVVLRIKLRYTELDEFIAKFATNVSAAGMFVRSKNPKDPGTMVAFELRLADGSAVIRGRGEVRWIRPYEPDNPRQPYGMGIAFTQLDGDSRELVERIVTLKREKGVAEPDGKIPHRLPTEKPEAEPEPEPEPEPLPPARPQRPRSTVSELLARLEESKSDGDIDGDDLDGLLDSDVSVDAALARARQITSSKVTDDLLDDLARPPVIPAGPELVPTARSRKSRRRPAPEPAATIPTPIAEAPSNGSTIPAPIPEPIGSNGADSELADQAARVDKLDEDEPESDNATAVDPAQIAASSSASLPPALEELESGPIGSLLENDEEIEAALATLLPEAEPGSSGEVDFSHLEIGDEVGFHKIRTEEVLDELEDELERDRALAEKAQRSIDEAGAAADAAGRFVDDAADFDFSDDEGPAPLGNEDAIDLMDLPPLEEAGPGDPTFISDMPSAALASDLANDSENELGGGRPLDELLDPEEPLATDRVHGVEDFISDSPAQATPLGVDLDETLAVLDTSEEPPPPPGPPPPPPPGHRRAKSSLPPPPPQPRPRPSSTRPPDSIELDIDEEIGDPEPLVDIETEQIGRKKKGFFKRIFNKD